MHLPIRRPSFAGTANRTLDGSQPDWNLISATRSHVKALKAALADAQQRMAAGEAWDLLTALAARG